MKLLSVLVIGCLTVLGSVTSIAEPAKTSRAPTMLPTTFPAAHIEAEVVNEWVGAVFGRPHQNQLNWSTDPEITRKFIPSGLVDQVISIGDYTVISTYGVYWSNEEEPDTSKDMQASVLILSKDGQKVFVARGYKFLEFHRDREKKIIQFCYWSGVNISDMTLFTVDCAANQINVSTKPLSTKEHDRLRAEAREKAVD